MKYSILAGSLSSLGFCATMASAAILLKLINIKLDQIGDASPSKTPLFAKSVMGERTATKSSV